MKLFNLFYLWRQNFVSMTRDYFFDLFAYLYIKIYLIILFTINLVIWLAAHYIDSKIGEELLALHYNVDFGINLIGEPKKIYIIPLLGFLVILINFILLDCISKQKDGKFVSHILLVAALIVNIVLLAAIAAIYLINFR